MFQGSSHQLLCRYMKLLAAREGQAGAAAGCTEVSSQTVAPLAKGKPVQTLPVAVQDQACQACPLPADCFCTCCACCHICMVSCTAGCYYRWHIAEKHDGLRPQRRHTCRVQHLSCTGQARVLSFCPGPASRGPLLQAYGADILQATAGASSHADLAAASSSREAGAASPTDAAGPPVPADASGAASQAEASAPAATAPAPEPDSGEAGPDRGAAAQHDVIGAASASTGPGMLLCRKPGLHAAGACVSATAWDWA